VMGDIRSLIIAGHSYHDIIRQLHLEPRTFYRLLNKVFEDDRRLLVDTTDDVTFLNEMAICKERFLAQYQNVVGMACDSSLDPSDRNAAHHLAAEIAAAVLRLHEGGPGLLAQRHQFPKSSLTAPETTGLRLVLKEQEQEQQEDHQQQEEEEEDEETKRVQERKVRAKGIVYD
jgi:hypothetical protein